MGQPLKENVSTDELKQNDRKEITMADFRYRSSFREPDPAFDGFLQKKPGYAFLGSALIPGAGQAANNKWIRAGTYLLADAVFITVHFSNLNKARDRELQYRQFADNNWSVVAYAQWLVNYHEQNNISNPAIDQLREQVEGESPTYNPQTDWAVVDLNTLRQVEQNTPFLSEGGQGNNFSHTLPQYGSQQYYELISKYYQYGPGWSDFGTNRSGQPIDNPFLPAWNGTDMPQNFIQGATLAEQFNNHYRIAGNMISLLIFNHVVSAFDAFLTVKIRNHRLEADANLLRYKQLSIKYHF